MRITGGRARGIPLKAPRGSGTRPTTDRLREAVFSSLGERIRDCQVADLFAGTGSYGLEAISRGAATATFYETDRTALNCLRQNVRAVLRSCDLNTNIAKVVTRDIFSPQLTHSAYHLLFVDPPYEMIDQHLQLIFENAISPLAHPDARVLIELPGNLDPHIPNWQSTRRIGKKGKDKPTVLVYQRT